MDSRRTSHYLHYTAIGILLVLLFLLQSSIGSLPRFFSVSAAPLIPAVICISMFEREMAGACFGLVAGILMDINSIQIAGFNALFLLLLGCICGLLVSNLLTNSLLSALALSAGSCLLYYLVYWMLFYVFKGFDHAIYYLFRYSLIGAFYTLLYTIPIYLVLRKISRRNRRA